MKITKILCGIAAANCYVLECDTAAVIIDPGYLEPELVSYAKRLGDKCKYILLTHRHFDHVCAAVALKKLINADILIHKDDECGLYDDEKSLTAMCNGFYGHANGDERADRYINDGDVITAGDICLKVIGTPGHSPGGVCFLCDNMLFSGDTIFEGTVGRTDMLDSNPSDFIVSLKKLLALPDSTIVYSGHGESTTIGRERISNPFLRFL